MKTRRASPLDAARTILWAFLGVGGGRDPDRQARLTPLHLIVAGVLGGAMFVVGLIALVRLIVNASGAAV